MKVSALILIALTGGLSLWAQKEPFLPVLAVEELTVSHLSAYAQYATQANTRMKVDHDVPLFLRLYAEASVTGERGSAFLLSPAANFEALLENLDLFTKGSEFASLRNAMNEHSSSGATTFLKAIRFDGTNAPGWLYNTLLETNNEAALSVQVSRLEALCESFGLPKPMINVFRVISGGGEFTHLVSVNCPSKENVAAILEALASESFSLGFTNSDQTYGNAIRSAVYRELKTQNP